MAGRFAGLTLAASMVIATVAAVIQVITRHVSVEYYGLRGFQGPFGVVIVAIGWLIATRVRRNPIGWIFLGVGFISTIQAFESAYVTLSVSEYGGSLPLTMPLVWLSVWIWVPVVGLLATAVLILFPEGRVETTRQGAVLTFAPVAIGLFSVAIALSPGQAGEVPTGLHNPYSLSKEQAEPLMAIGGGLFIAAVALSVGVLVKRFRGSTGDVRQQMKWITFAASIAAVALSLSTGALFAGSSIDNVFIRAAAIAVILGFVGIPIAAGIAVLRYGLYEIDLVINKTIVYALLAVFITLVYVGIVVGVGALVGSGANTGLTVAATAIVALAAQPVRGRATRLANRFVFGARATPYEALSAFSARLSEESEEALPRLARLMTEATAADRAHVWLAVGAQLQPVAAWPSDLALEPQVLEGNEPSIAGADRVYPVRHEGELLGALAAATQANDPLNAGEDRLLADLAAQAGLLLRNARLIEELRASRQRLVAAQDMERRRIERDLHDGAQQQLVALAVNLKLLERMVSDDTARQVLDQLRTDTTDALENLRDLARGIYPPLLAERGLVAALTSQLAKAPLPVEVSGEDVGRYPQEAESALYFCVLEAVQNITKYADATRVTVRVAATDGRLRFEVIDEGSGFDVRSVRRGAGLTNMADRLEALGGALEIRSQRGAGTTVAGWVAARPLAST
ncbi:MAG TPA: histidine kinase [Actinomycetota bacterium]